MREIVAIWYRGSKYQIGRGRDFYGIWPAADSVSHPLERWPLTREGWSGAWARFTAVEAPGTIVQAGPATSTPSGPYGAPAGPRIFMPAGPARPAAPRPEAPIVLPASVPVGQRGGPLAARASRPAVIAAGLLAVGIVSGVIGLFPGYLNGESLAQHADQLVPHVIYLAGWTVSALLILLGGDRARLGALLGMGLSVVTFGFFLADLGSVIAGGTQVMGAGLPLALVGWLFCAAGSLAAFLLLRTGAPGWSRGTRVDSVLALTLAGLGAAIAFAPSWDRYTLHTAAGVSQTITAGDAFKNPGPVIAGDVVVMVALVAVVVAAALWRPARYGAALLAGAIIPMAAEAISAVIQVAEGVSPTLFGISPGQAAQAGLTISSGLTPAFWIYCAFVAALAVLCGLMLRSHSGRPDASPPGPVTLDATQPPTSAFR